MVTCVFWFLPPKRMHAVCTSVTHLTGDCQTDPELWEQMWPACSQGTVCQGTGGLGEAGKCSCHHVQAHTCLLLVEAICSLTLGSRVVVVLLNVSQAQLEKLHPIGENLGLMSKVIWIFPQPVSTRLCLHVPAVVVDEGLVIYEATGKKCRDSWARLSHG